MDRKEAAKKAKDLVARMTLEEKASQLKYDAPAIRRLGIPEYNWWNEALHGVARAGTATSFPQAIGLAAMFDDQFLSEIADIIATEGRAKYNASRAQEDGDIYKGLTFWSPNVNIFRDPRWGRGHETYGEDPFLTSRLGVAFIKGLQGDGAYMKGAACAKHFAVHSGPEELRHEFNATVTEKDLYETYLPAFEACVKEGKVEAVMGAYNRTNGEPCCGSYRLIRNILRGDWGFQGHYVSDCWALKDFHEHHKVTDTAWDSAALALKAGCDMNCGSTYLHILKAYQKGMVTEAEITQAAERLFTTRYLLGMFEENEYDQITYDKVACREHLRAACRAAEKSAVLLKNNGILPLRKEKINSIGVIGPNADSRIAMIGNYYGTPPRYITVLEGIMNEVGDDVRVYYSEGCHLWNDRVEPLAGRRDRISEAVTVAKQSDVVVLCLGLDETLEGEEMDQGNHAGSGDKKDLLLPETQRDLLEHVCSVGKPVIVCILAGSALDLERAQELSDGMIQLWYPGAGGGKAVANLLFGKTSPSGKLPITFYRTLDNLPEFTDYSMKNRTYRYMQEEALYPFGYGLTYGETKVTGVEFASVPTAENGASVFVKVLNAGVFDTEDVVQVYIKDLQSRFAVTNYSLCGYCRVSLSQGKELQIIINIPPSAFEVVDDEGKRYIDSGIFELYIGFSQPDTRSMELTGQEPRRLKVVLEKK